MTKTNIKVKNARKADKVPYWPKSVRGRMKKLRSMRKILGRNQYEKSNEALYKKIGIHTTDKMDFVKSFIINYIVCNTFEEHKLPPNVCSHFLIPSTLISKMLDDSFTFHDVHAHLFNAKKKFKIAAHESDETELFDDLHFANNQKSGILPFIVGKAQFLQFKGKEEQNASSILDLESCSQIKELEKIAQGKNVEFYAHLGAIASIYRCPYINIYLFHKPYNCISKALLYKSYKLEIIQDIIGDNADMICCMYFDRFLIDYFKIVFCIEFTELERESLRDWFRNGYYAYTHELATYSIKSGSSINMSNRKKHFSRCIKLSKDYFFKNVCDK